MNFSDVANQEQYPFSLPDLPYEKHKLEPYFTPESFDFHHGKHHKAYVDNLNKIIQDNTIMHEMNLEKIILKSFNSNQTIFNNAAQIWNHSFFWHSIKPNGGGLPTGRIFEQIQNDFNSFEEFSKEFKQAAVSQFGSGWVWLVFDMKKLRILKTSNANTPITNNLLPIICCDVWEHAYYIDYRNKRPDYAAVVIDKALNWEFANNNLERAESFYSD